MSATPVGHGWWPLGRREVRRALGVLWLFDAALQAQPTLFGADWWRNDLAQSVMAQPNWVSRSILWAVGVISAHAAAYNVAFVVIEFGLGLALLTDRWPRSAIAVSVPYALGVWWVGEGFGGLLTGFALLPAGAPGAALLYLLLGWLAWPRRGDPGRGVAQRAGRGAWVFLWTGLALLQLPWVYSLKTVLAANVEEHALGQLRWQLTLAHWIETAVRADPVALSSALAAIEVLIGLGVLNTRTRRLALGAGIGASFVFWVTVQYFGDILGGDATDPGSAPLLILLAAALWPRSTAWPGRRPAPPPGGALRTRLRAGVRGVRRTAGISGFARPGRTASRSGG